MTNPMDNLPTLPSEISKGTAALWAANILMQTGLDRGWDGVDITDLLISLAVIHGADRHTDRDFQAIVQAKLDGIRSMRAQGN